MGGALGGVAMAEAVLLGLPRELDDQDRVLGRQADQHDKADLRQDIIVHAHQIDAQDRCQQTHRHDQDHRQRQDHAFILRGEQQEDEQHGQPEHIDTGVTRLLLLEGEIGPFKGHALGQRLGRQARHRLERLARGIAARGVSLQLGRGIEIVAHDAIGTGVVLHRQHRAERHHAPARCARAQLLDIRDLLAERRVGLRGDAPGAAEIVKVIDVG